jgi:glycosyltransferase involved in cell wall biosynthesis
VSVDNIDYKICIASEFPPPNGGIAGQAQILYESLLHEKIIVKKIEQNGYLKGPFKKYHNKRYIKSLIAFLNFFIQCLNIIPKMDIIHILSSSYLNFFLFTLPAVLLGKLLGKKVIIHYHGGSAEDFIEKWRISTSAILRLSDHLIFPSEFLSNVFDKYGFNGVIIPNILNLDSFKFKKRNEFLPKFIVTRHLRSEYNVACVIRAFSLIREQYPSAVLRIVGDGVEKKSLMELSKKLGCDQSIFFLGHVPNERLPNLYDCSDFVLNSSMVDNMPVSIMEAFASGCLVITTRAGGIPFLIKHRENGFLVDLDDHEALAKEALWSLCHQDETCQIVKNAREYALRFSWEMVKKKLFQIYSN